MAVRRKKISSTAKERAVTKNDSDQDIPLVQVANNYDQEAEQSAPFPADIQEVDEIQPPTFGRNARGGNKSMTFPAGSVLIKPAGLNIKIDDEIQEKGNLSERSDRNPV